MTVGEDMILDSAHPGAVETRAKSVRRDGNLSERSAGVRWEPRGLAAGTNEEKRERGGKVKLVESKDDHRTGPVFRQRPSRSRSICQKSSNAVQRLCFALLQLRSLAPLSIPASVRETGLKAIFLWRSDFSVVRGPLFLRRRKTRKIKNPAVPRGVRRGKMGWKDPF